MPPVKGGKGACTSHLCNAAAFAGMSGPVTPVTPGTYPPVPLVGVPHNKTDHNEAAPTMGNAENSS